MSVSRVEYESPGNPSSQEHMTDVKNDGKRGPDHGNEQQNRRRKARQGNQGRLQGNLIAPRQTERVTWGERRMERMRETWK